YPPRSISHDGETLTLAEWAKRTGIPVGTIRSRIDQQGWSVADALGTPVKAKFNPRRAEPIAPPKPCPPLKAHASSGQAYCRWMVHGKEHWRYFGEAGTKAAAEAYRRFQMEWAARGSPPPPAGDTMFVCELAEQYLAHVDHYYRKDGKPTPERHHQRTAIGALVELYPDVPVAEFRATHLRTVVAALVKEGYARRTVNTHKWRITRCFSWGVGQDLVPPDVAARLEHVENLQRGRTEAPDYPRVESAPVADVEATIPHLHEQPNRRTVLEAMVRTHLLVGCRPHELCAMTADAIDTTGELWCFRYGLHKNLHREQAAAVKRIWIGARAQKVMRPYLDAAAATGGPLWVLPPVGKGKRTTRVSRGLYGMLVAAACERAGVKPWTPHQLRHTRATEVERVYESDAAAAAAIGDTPRVAAEVYVDQNDAVAKRIAKELG
ncbi:MAG TPA: site-specific integrase, partial [Urbifossiella sp.]|nr:site-specific integrase [Urbifossiella sp.]